MFADRGNSIVCMQLETLLYRESAVCGCVADFLSDRDLYTAAQSSFLLHTSFGWVAEPIQEQAVTLDTLPLEVTERLHAFIPTPDILELTAGSLTLWKLFAREFSISPQTCLSKYLSDPIISART